MTSSPSTPTPTEKWDRAASDEDFDGTLDIYAADTDYDGTFDTTN